MNGNSQNDDILFDRLVDGELSSAERHTLLESLDARPNGWRRCALAFLEAQSWKADLPSMATAYPSAGTEEITKSAAPTARAKRRNFRTAAEWLVVAAGLLIAFKLGSLQSGPAIPIIDNRNPTNEQVATAPQATEPAAPNATKPGDALNLWVRDDAGQMRRVRVPLVDANKLDNELGLVFQTGVPDDIRDRLQNHGYDLQSKRRYAPMWLDNGRQMIVPVEDTKIVPVSNKVY
jgi:hypothetical protein